MAIIKIKSQIILMPINIPNYFNLTRLSNKSPYAQNHAKWGTQNDYQAEDRCLYGEFGARLFSQFVTFSFLTASTFDLSRFFACRLGAQKILLERLVRFLILCIKTNVFRFSQTFRFH